MENQTSILRLINSLSTYDTNDIEFLKWQAHLQTINMKLPTSSSKLLEKIMKDESITPSEFVEKFQQIIASTDSWTWKLNLFVIDLFGDLKTFISQLYWTEILVFLGFFLFVFLLDKQFNMHKPFFWLKKSNEILLERILAFLGLLVPYLEICNTYLRPELLLQRYPYLRLLLTDFIRSLLQIYEKNGYIPFFYLIIIYGVFLRNRFPKSRFVRFNWMLGLIIILLQSNVNQIYYPLLANLENLEQKRDLTFIVFFLNLVVLVPCMFRALLGRYPSNKFLRENIELHLGRDGTDFKWWDRK